MIVAAVMFWSAPGLATVPSQIRVIVGYINPNDTQEKRETTIDALRREFSNFLKRVEVKGRPRPQIVFWDPLRQSADPAKFMFEEVRPDVLIARLSKENDDVLAYVWGSLRSGKTGGQVAEHTFLIRPAGRPRRFQEAKAVRLKWSTVYYEPIYIIAYAMILQAYSARDFEIAVAIAAEAKRQKTAAARSFSQNSPCFRDLLAAIETIGIKASEQLRLGAARTGRMAVPSNALPDPLECN